MAESKYATTSIQLPPAHLAALQALAREQGVTVSAVVRWAISAFLKTDAPQA